MIDINEDNINKLLDQKPFYDVKRNIYIVLNMLLAYARKQKHMTYNPLENVEKPVKPIKTTEEEDIEYIEADARSFKRPDFFDTAVNLYISFGYFENPADDLLVARNVYESLKPGGSFIIETLGKEIAIRDFTPGEWFERAGYTVLTEYEAVDSWAVLKNRWILIRNPKETPDREPPRVPATRIEKTFTQRLYAATELRSLLFEAGFSVVELYGAWDERPYDQEAQALIAVGRKGD